MQEIKLPETVEECNELEETIAEIKKNLKRMDLAKSIADTYVEYNKQLTDPNELEGVLKQLWWIALQHDVIFMVNKILKEEYGVNLTFARKAE